MKSEVKNPQIIVGLVLFDIDHDREIFIDRSKDPERRYKSFMDGKFNYDPTIHFAAMHDYPDHKVIFQNMPSHMLKLVPADHQRLHYERPLLMDKRIFSKDTFREPGIIQELNATAVNKQHGTYLVTPELRHRLSGHLPHALIEGEDYTIDVRNDRLWGKGFPWEAVDLSKAREKERADHYFYFNQITKRLTPYNPDASTVPKNCVIVGLPRVGILDPVGSQAKGFGPALALITDHSYSSRITAKRLELDQLKPNFQGTVIKPNSEFFGLIPDESRQVANENKANKKGRGI